MVLRAIIERRGSKVGRISLFQLRSVLKCWNRQGNFELDLLEKKGYWISSLDTSPLPIGLPLTNTSPSTCKKNLPMQVKIERNNLILQ